MALTPGVRLGPYEIVGPLGAGGMGEVYRARDTRLDRDVAVKVLPDVVARDADALARFEREARAVAALNHPNICALHDVGREGDTHYLVMELLEGETLAARLRSGPLPLDEALAAAVQIAGALDRAHRDGVVHRDLKPGNVMLTRGGVKLLDFGLAKLQAPGSPFGGDSRVTRTTPLTAGGTLLGTPQYMSPEQLEGREADARSDLWAFGCVLYEMLVGHRAFAGGSQASVIAAILKEPAPQVIDRVPLAPPALDRLVRTCLEKNPDDRWQSAADLRRELAWMAGDSLSQPPRSTPASPLRSRPRVSWLPWVVATIGLATALASAWLWSTRGDLRSAAVATPVEFTIATYEAGDHLPHGAVSRDGQWLAYPVFKAGAGKLIAVRRLDRAEPRLLEGTNGASDPAWSPDGSEAAFFARQKLWAIAAAGGARPRPICDAGYGLGATWTDAGSVVFSSGFFEGLRQVDRLGGVPRPLTSLDASRGETGHGWPVALPGGRHVVFISRTTARESNRVEAVSLEGGARTVVVEADALAGYAAPWLVFVRAGALLGQRFDPATLALSGEPRVLVESVRFEQTWMASGARASADTLTYTPHLPDPTALRWIDAAGRDLGRAVEEVDVRSVRVAPVGTMLMIEKLDRERGAGDVWLLDLARGGRTRLSSFSGDEDLGAWMPDGASVVYTSDIDGPYALVRQAADALAKPQTIVIEPGHDWATEHVSHDGRWVLAHRFAATEDTLWLVDSADPTRRTEWLGGGLAAEDARFSPDGAWIAFAGTSGGQTEIYVRQVSGGAATPVSVGGGRGPRWAPDGRALYFIDGGSALQAVPLRTAGASLQPGPPRQIGVYPTLIDYDVAPDGRLLLALASSADQVLRVRVGWR